MDLPANDHHLVMGELTDYLTGETLADTHDERYRQKIARLLVDNGFARDEIQGRFSHELRAGDRTAVIKIDFTVRVKGKLVLMVKYAPGSLVTRRLSTLALARTLVPYQIPVVVVTNGEDAEIIDGSSGKVVGQGMAGIPTKESILNLWSGFTFHSISPGVMDQASRIAFACEVSGACPCDTDVCILENG